jgi:ATP-dependent exoDNAse (exonuclease V) beta subunit
MKSETKLIDQEQRDRAAQDISGSYIVEAAAGTGKTTVLVTRILNLIKAGEARLEEIVAITFTEKAAAELKVKLRQELEKTLSNEPASGEHQRIAEAISDLERMQVTTIHSFCGSLLRERPVEAGLDPNFEVADALVAGKADGRQRRCLAPGRAHWNHNGTGAQSQPVRFGKPRCVAAPATRPSSSRSGEGRWAVH